jgi:hypothetical protein
MRDFLFLIFNEMNIEGYRQGTLIDEVEPEVFFTYWNVSDSDEYADNIPNILKNSYSVYLYVHETKLLEDDKYLDNKIKEFKRIARSYGLVVASSQDIDSGLDKYLGKMCRVEYIQHE